MFINQNYLTESASNMARSFGCSKSAVLSYLKKNDLKVPDEIKAKFRSKARTGHTNYTAAEDEIIRREYLKMPIKRLAETLLPGRSYTGIMSRLKAMGLEIPAEVINDRKEQSRIQPGNRSFNKGKKQAEYMTAEAIEKTKATRFKKGQLPTNTLTDFAITTRKDKSGITYKHIRIGLAKWVLYHRYVYEQQYGPIPTKHIIAFKDGNSLNCNIENLELLTMAENVKRNSGSINLTDGMIAHYLATESRKTDLELKEELLKHPDLIGLKRNQLLLKRAIKTMEKHDTN